MLTPNKIEELFRIIEKQRIVFVATHVGDSYLTTSEKRKLSGLGIDASKLYSKGRDFMLHQFYFGLISDAVGQDAKNISYDQLKAHMQSADYIPLTKPQKYSLESIKNQFLGDITGKQNEIFSDLNNIINTSTASTTRKRQEEVIRGEIERGFISKQTYNETSREIARKTGDWSRNFGRVVEFVSHAAFNEGRASAYELDGGDETYMYFNVFPRACKHCIRLYLTNGIGSKPIVFKLSTLRSYGNNIGRKVAEWKASLFGVHPFCRCSVSRWQKGFEWDDKKKMFVRKRKIVIEGREPIPVKIGGKTYQL